MKRSTAGTVLSALALAGTAVLAAPSLAGEGGGETEARQGEADMVPVQSLPGEQVRIFDSSCWEGTTDIWWALRPEDGPEVLATGQEPLAADGSWEVTLTAPAEPAWYLFTGLCLPPGVDTPDTALIDEIRDTDGAPDELFEEWGVDTLLYYAQIVEVVAPGTTPTTPPATTPTTSPTESTVPAGPTTTVPASVGPPAPPAQPVPDTPTFTG